eukprot:3250451-Amphidinium_carterae.1
MSAQYVIECQMLDDRRGIDHWRSWTPDTQASQLPVIEPLSVPLYVKCAVPWCSKSVDAYGCSLFRDISPRSSYL